MSTTTRPIAATPDQVWEVLADGWLYPVWVVGASRMREVDASWPATGSRLHHSVGVWPALLDDNTEVTDCVPGRSLTLRARAWPTGEARVHLRLDPTGSDTTVVIEEKPVSGPAALLPPVVHGPGLKWRNTETLRRLALIAEGRS